MFLKEEKKSPAANKILCKVHEEEHLIALHKPMLANVIRIPIISSLPVEGRWFLPNAAYWPLFTDMTAKAPPPKPSCIFHLGVVKTAQMTACQDG